MRKIGADSRSRNAAVRAPLPDLPLANLLKLLAGGAILESQARSFSIRGNRVPTKVARDLIQNGLVAPPPDIFTPMGGRITQEGLIKLKKLEDDHD